MNQNQVNVMYARAGFHESAIKALSGVVSVPDRSGSVVAVDLHAKAARELVAHIEALATLRSEWTELLKKAAEEQ